VGLVCNNAVALLAMVALAADGLAALAESPRAAARPLGLAALIAVAAIGAAVTVTTGAGRATPLHDALIVAFFAWSATMWALYALAADDGRWRALLLVAVATIGVCDAWFGNVPRLEAQLHTVRKVSST
jgi:hypothetical protein